MKTSHLSFDSFSASPLLTAERTTAHSGPELVGNVPDEKLAHALASSLLQDRIEIIEQVNHNSNYDSTGLNDYTLRRL